MIRLPLGHGPMTVAAYAVLRSNKQLKLVPLKVDQGLVWGAAFRKDDAATRNAVEEAIECMKLDGTVASEPVYQARERICDLGYLRVAVRSDDGSIDYRCPAEPSQALRHLLTAS